MITESGHDATFQCFHSFGFILVNMVMTQQMQHAMNDHVRPVRTGGFTLFPRFLLHDVGTHDQIAQHPQVRQIRTGRKR